MELLPLVVSVMVFYDFSLHLLELLLGYEKARKIKYYWPAFEKEGKFSRQSYTLFWTAYWGLALLLLAIHIFAR